MLGSTLATQTSFPLPEPSTEPFCDDARLVSVIHVRARIPERPGTPHVDCLTEVDPTATVGRVRNAPARVSLVGRRTTRRDLHTKVRSVSRSRGSTVPPTSTRVRMDVHDELLEAQQRVSSFRDPIQRPNDEKACDVNGRQRQEQGSGRCPEEWRLQLLAFVRPDRQSASNGCSWSVSMSGTRGRRKATTHGNNPVSYPGIDSLRGRFCDPPLVDCCSCPGDRMGRELRTWQRRRCEPQWQAAWTGTGPTTAVSVRGERSCGPSRDLADELGSVCRDTGATE